MAARSNAQSDDSSSSDEEVADVWDLLDCEADHTESESDCSEFEFEGSESESDISDGEI